MRYFPVFLDLKEKSCVVIGGGRVAERKIQNLRKAGAAVTVVSPRLIEGLKRLKQANRIRHLPRSYRRGDLKDAYLAIAATDDRSANERVFREATALRIPVNVVDDPLHCSFIVPAVVSRGDILLAISTGGQSPALAKALRKKLQKEIGPEYTALLKMIGAIRKKIIPRGWGQKKNREIYQRLFKEDVIEMVRQRDLAALNRLFKKLLGLGFSLEEKGPGK